MHSYIKWAYLNVNEEDYFSHKDKIFIKSSEQHESYLSFTKKYPELSNVLFTYESNYLGEGYLKLNIPSQGYLGTDSNTDDDVVLRKFLNNNNKCKNNNIPIVLSEDSYDDDAYDLFCSILRSFADWDEDGTEYGYLTIGFDDTKDCICCNGSEEAEINITIDESGVCWDWWE